MINKLNLATRPFRNRNLPYILAVLLLACSVAGAVLCFAQLRNLRNDNETVKSDVKTMTDETTRLKGAGEQVQQNLSPEQRALLIASHKLVANKTFGWSRLFADLEGVMPGDVSASVIKIENVYKENDRTKAELEFGVLSRDYQSVTNMIERMNNSGIFQAELRGQDRQKNERFVFTEYTLRLIYLPSYGYSPTAPANDVAQSLPGGLR